MNTRGSWWYIEVLWSEVIGLCKKLKIIYDIITWYPEPQGIGNLILFCKLVWTGSVKAPNSYVKTWMWNMSKAYKVNKIVFFSSPFYIDKEKQ